MAEKKRVQKEYDYDRIIISLENCILPEEKIDVTPSMNDGLDRDTENDIRMFGCELLQIVGLLLKLPQVAMATGQVILQRFYYSTSLVKHEVEVSAMAAIFLAAKIEESPRRIRDVINVYVHVKQRFLGKSHSPMDFLSNHYYNLKNAIIKSERRILKELGFCVHVKHPHKIIITYLQILEHEKNVSLARKAWNYMNDSLRTDVFVRFSPEIIACACIFLAARVCKVNLPTRPSWWELFDATYDDIEEISLCILRLYSRPKRKITHLEAIVNKLKKAKAEEKKEATSQDTPINSHGSFTPSYIANTTQKSAVHAINNNNSSRPSSKTNSPVDKPTEKGKRTLVSAIVAPKRPGSSEQKRHNRRRRACSDTDNTSEYSSDSGAELPSKKYAQQQTQYENNKKNRSPSSESDNERPVIASKIRRSDSPIFNHKSRPAKDARDRGREDINKSNGQTKNYESRDRKRRSRSRSPVKRRSRSSSPSRKNKYENKSNKERIRGKHRQKEKYHNYEKYVGKVRR